MQTPHNYETPDWAPLERAVLAAGLPLDEHGVKVVTWITRGGEVDPDTGETKGGYKFCRTTTVFHVSQTDANEAMAVAS